MTACLKCGNACESGIAKAMQLCEACWKKAESARLDAKHDQTDAKALGENAPEASR